MPQVLHRLVPSYLPRSDPSMTKRKPAQLPYRGMRRQLPLTTVGQVPPLYRENLVRLVYFTAGCAQGMDPRDAIRYAGKMWAQTSVPD